MRWPKRIALAVGIVLVGTFLGLFFGAQYPTCLGPIGVTLVQCVSATGVVPKSGPGTVIFALSVALALGLLVPGRLLRHREVILGAAAAAIAGAFAYLLRRPTTLEGFDSGGRWLSVALPVDVFDVLLAVILGATAGAVAVACVLALLSARRTST
ncbi:MAG TPA: hypothetical protein VGO64_07365 [Candidatus Limnocylindrales bacterium]|jgi:hypothetical protein|nr:hypothetical protein [Candidatus Limnocylindrales bacterium]